MSTETEVRGHRKERVGKVVSSKMDKSIVVLAERRVRHELYGKEIKRTKKFYVHDEENAANVGDTVRIVETRPLSRTKNWRLAEILERGDD